MTSLVEMQLCLSLLYALTLQEMEQKAIHQKVIKDKGKTKLNLAYSKKNLADEKLRAAAAAKAEKEQMEQMARANKLAAVEG